MVFAVPLTILAANVIALETSHPLSLCLGINLVRTKSCYSVNAIGRSS